HKCLVVVLVWVVLAEGTTTYYGDINIVCCNTQACSECTKFDPQQSSTATAKCLYFYLPYETRSLGGVFRCDTVNVGDIVITNQIFLTAFSDYPNLSISAGRRTPLMDNMITQNLLSSKIFCFFLSRYSFDNQLSSVVCSLSENRQLVSKGTQKPSFCMQIPDKHWLVLTELVNYIMQCHGSPTICQPCAFLLVLPPPAYVIQQNQNGCQYCSVSMTPTYQPSPNGQPLRTFGDYGWTNSQVGFAIVV
uniref:Peptidase A1 domain-containing protein n=1 Tax=Haplochromis burtoni TaxID=8153 RepID=A0A3Q3BY16_HAPBU